MQCTYKNRSNKQCGAHAMTGSEFCFSHNPETVEDKKTAVVRGGKAPRRTCKPLPQMKINNIKDVSRLLVVTINEVRNGEIDIRVANCLGYLSGHLIRAYEGADIEERLAKIEQALESKNV